MYVHYKYTDKSMYLLSYNYTNLLKIVKYVYVLSYFFKF